MTEQSRLGIERVIENKVTKCEANVRGERNAYVLEIVLNKIEDASTLRRCRSGVRTRVFGWRVGAAVGVETVPRPILLVSSLSFGTTPNGKVGIGVSFNVFVDIVLGGEIVWIASNVDLTLWLVDADVVDEHLAWELQVGPVDRTETG